MYRATFVKQNIYEITVVEENIKVYYICLHDGQQWIHQGNRRWLSFEISGHFLPFFAIILLIVLLLLISALFSGLTIGLMALDKHELKVLVNSGTESERRNAKAVLPLREHGNFLLCSLIIGNTVVNSTLAVLLNSIAAGLIAVIVSTLSIVIIGEIIPQAICARYGLVIGAKTIYITYVVVILTSPVSYPLSKMLDCVLGVEIGKFYDRDCLQEYIRLTKTATRLEDDEFNVIQGALEYNRKTVSSVMTPLDQVYMISASEKLDKETVSEIAQRGYSRIPIYSKERSNVVGLLYVKDIIVYFNSEYGQIPIETIIKSSQNYLITVPEDYRLKSLLDEFKQGKCHMAIVQSKDKETIGVVTMEDILEEILQSEILDETDIIINAEKKLTRKVTQKNVAEILKIGEGRSASYFELSPQLLNAILIFLTSTVKPFSDKYISNGILRRLLTQKIYYEIKTQNGYYQGRSLDTLPALYTNGVASDYFILIVEGTMRAMFGSESRSYECKPFTYFGVSALHITDEELYKLQQKLTLTENLNKPFASKYFMPDFTLKIGGDCLYMKITRTLYLTACRAYLTDQKAESQDSATKSEVKNIPQLRYTAKKVSKKTQK
ncbi:metal transporter CNNM4-like protein [Leptotrombidium deliense]|uniref:Metal transporter CNNM4-like protein n=1 Tax=Leptotrombidium deliense TaxID=299467 RepID=A0A443SAC9_9ACAR|nr:metal transporter CNNM4-like protein [Leptotrombidium deliense]